jgi:hypothetical protein
MDDRVSHVPLTCYLTQRNAVKFVKKGFGEKEVEAVLQRLDRLTQDEARTTAAQSLEVVYGLVQNMRAVMDGEQTHLPCNPASIEYRFLQTAKHRLMMSGKSSVRFVGENELVRCLIER